MNFMSHDTWATVLSSKQTELKFIISDREHNYIILTDKNFKFFIYTVTSPLKIMFWDRQYFYSANFNLN